MTNKYNVGRKQPFAAVPGDTCNLQPTEQNVVAYSIYSMQFIELMEY